MSELATLSLLSSATEIANCYPSVGDRLKYKKLIDAIKSLKAKTPEVMRADIEAQVALADAIDEAMERGEATKPDTGPYQVGTYQVPGAEVDRWRKLRAIPEEDRQEYYRSVPKPSRNGLLRWRDASVVDGIVLSSRSEDRDAVCELERLPRRHFGCVYADPPWQYGNQGTRAATDNHYQTMTIEQLCEMPISELVADDAHLHLWTTNAFIREAFEVIEAWGFEYRSMFVWVKPQIGIGNYWRVSHELLLLGIRGNAKRFNDRSLRSWLEADRTKHSAKPDAVRKMIERASHGPYLELFGRKMADGWTVFGNQISEEFQSSFLASSS